MKNLHLMPMGSVFDEDLIIELNANFPHVENEFILKSVRNRISGFENCQFCANVFSAKYINENEYKYNKVFLHSLFLDTNQLFMLNERSLHKLVWIVWGHDLYDNKGHSKLTANQYVSVIVHGVKKILRGTYIKMYLAERKRAKIISRFNSIGIGYKYDELMIRKKYGPDVRVVYGPYFSRTTEENVNKLREKHRQKEAGPINIMIGHSGFDFLEHERYLNRLSKYKHDNLHIYLILSYGATKERIQKLSDLANSIFGESKCTIITEMMSKDEYYEYLTKMDIAIFPFKHQSALGNTKRLAYMGVKLYLHPKGILYKGFKDSGVKTYNCLEIGKISFEKLCRNDTPVDTNAPLFDTFNYKNNVEAWRKLLETE